MQLNLLVRAYIDARNSERPIGRELSADYCEQLFENARVYGAHLGCIADCSDFNAASLNAFLRALVDKGLSFYTVKTRRTGLRVLWRFANRNGLAPPWEGVRSIHCPPLRIEGYSSERMAVLLKYIATLPGTVPRTGIPRAIYWDSFARADWEVGLRIADMTRVCIEHFDASGWLWILESKTGKSGWRRLELRAVESIARCIAANPNRTRIWPGYTPTNACRAFTKLAKSAGVGGTSKYIRRGGSSECDRLFPGQGWRFLRHSSPAVWEKYYRVDRICERDAPGPPPLAQ